MTNSLGATTKKNLSPPSFLFHLGTCRSSWSADLRGRLGRSPESPSVCRVFVTRLSLLQVLYGKVRVRCFDKQEDALPVGVAPPYFEPPLAPFQTASLRRSVLRSVCEYSEKSGPCLLTPVRDNLHQIDALEGPAAFLDILAPPYNPEDGRDCHYYKVLQTVAEGGACGKEEVQGQEKEAWLLEIPQPEEFWCGGESYPGPAVYI
ncbi:2-aminoethanethiol dioxygenase-like [Thalassophryne amazonica]|uniref:2-aminoethanethiol dioxygenase-like n=1 Tax=Thalassophryne amazonica TaxID=390379 RepID=UPI0014722A0C|nr:2-aminoethanethiol dioxygenase-like [Thalassophryne amazonica]